MDFASPYKLYWSTTEHGEIKFGVEATVPNNGWVGLGFNKNGVMTPSRAIIATLPSNTGRPQVQEYSLKGYASNLVTVATQPVIKGASVEYANGVVKFVFSISSKDEPSINLANGNTGFIYAVGPQPAVASVLSHHIASRSTMLNLSQGGMTVNILSLGINIPGTRSKWILAHGILMAVAWLLFTPIAIILASPLVRQRLFPRDVNVTPRHTTAHRILALLIVLIAATGATIALVVFGTHVFKAHLIIGLVVLSLMLIQIMLGTWRTLIPVEKPRGCMQAFGLRYKRCITICHQICGRLLWLLAVSNIILGLTIHDAPRKLRIAAYSVIGVCAVAVFVGPVLMMFRRKRN